MKLDFVLQSNIIENGFDLPFEFGKRAVLSWSEPELDNQKWWAYDTNNRTDSTVGNNLTVR